ncbi:hypothetical protein OH799_03570 [Nocardia sp. NBC_00881]|uniref:hypothetical protein n=1 Tax=Nocardia sp. NBC_00881 TaxID=2975995 RepID=UPI003869F800|nr:hypothetical protein OH799_03570 [Nocardia sp. NBC_00881]
MGGIEVVVLLAESTAQFRDLLPSFQRASRWSCRWSSLADPQDNPRPAALIPLVA